VAIAQILIELWLRKGAFNEKLELSGDCSINPNSEIARFGHFLGNCDHYLHD
jgi:hypothetical protein